MQIQIVKNKYLNALFLLMLLSAIIHMLLLFFITAITQNLYFLNFFNIIGLTHFLPHYFDSNWGNVVSVLCVLAIYLLILKINKHE